MKSALLCFFLAMLAFNSPVAGQQISSDATQLALEVRFYPNEPPSYQTISAASRRGTWYGRFGRVRGWKQPPDSPAVTAVNVKSELAEEGVRVWVSVFLGEIHEQENKVSSYVLREGEKVTVGELARLGVEPFEIKVVRLNPSVAELPQFFSKAKSIELVLMQPNFSTLPTYEVVMRNVSSKNVGALSVNVMQGGRPRIMSMPQGKEGQALIPPGGTYQFTAKLATQTTPSPDGYTPVILPNQVVEISSAVFDDGSFEGDSGTAIEFAAFQKGRGIQLARVIGLLTSAMSSNHSAAGSLSSLREEVSLLSLEANSAAVQEVHAKFPSADERRVKNMIEIAMRGVRDDVLNAIVQFQLRNRRVEANTFHDWLATSKQRYEAWLARL